MHSPMPLDLIVVGKISAHHTKEGASMNWKRMMKRNMNTGAAMFPPELEVPRYLRWRSASARRLTARAGKPITKAVSFCHDLIRRAAKGVRNSLRRPNLSIVKQATIAAVVPTIA